MTTDLQTLPDDLARRIALRGATTHANNPTDALLPDVNVWFVAHEAAQDSVVRVATDAIRATDANRGR